MIQEARKTGGNLLILDAGNLLFFKNIHPSLPTAQKQDALLSAQLMVQAFNSMGCDAVGIGADDLRLGAKDFDALSKTAQFPFVSANVVSKKGLSVSASSVVKNVGGLRWGIFGLMSANPSSVSLSKNWKVSDPVSAGREVLAELQDKADIIILLATMPLAELKTLLPQLPGVAIALAVGEPGGFVRPLQIGQTAVVCSPPYGKYLGKLQISLKDPKAALVDEDRIMQLETVMALVEKKIRHDGLGSSSEEKKRMETELQELKKGNTYRNEIIALSSDVREDPAMKKFIEDFRAEQQQAGTGCQ